MWQTEINPMAVRMFTYAKKLPQLQRAPIHDAVLAVKGVQGLIIGMPLTKPICGEMD